MTSDIEEAAYREAAERKAQAKASKAEAKAKKKALSAAKKAQKSADKQRAIDAARSAGYTGRLVLLNEETVVDRANREAAMADAETKRLKAEAKAKKKATKKAERSSNKLQKQMAMDAIRQTGWSRPVVMFDQRPYAEGFTYGELADIEQEWNKWAKKHGHDADSCMIFIRERCADTYPSEEEQSEIYGFIAVIEESKNKKPKKKATKKKTTPKKPAKKKPSVKKKPAKKKSKPKTRRK